MIERTNPLDTVYIAGASLIMAVTLCALNLWFWHLYAPNYERGHRDGAQAMCVFLLAQTEATAAQKQAFCLDWAATSR